MEIADEDFEFEGHGIFGFDNMKQKHFYVWIDNMGTLMMTAEGERDADGNIVYFSELPNPMSGGTMKIKSVSNVVNDDHHVFEMHEQLPDGAWHQTMKIDATTYTGSARNIPNQPGRCSVGSSTHAVAAMPRMPR